MVVMIAFSIILGAVMIINKKVYPGAYDLDKLEEIIKK